MAEHAAQARKPVPSDASARSPAAPTEAPPARRGEALAGLAQLLADRAGANVHTAPLRSPGPIQRMSNRTGLPDGLKTGVEALSGLSMDDVRVHRNSAAPAKLGALAYAQGSDIHLGPGQDRHLPHEAWHVVQQKQGRVRPTRQLKRGVDVNDQADLEREADVMGNRAMQAVGPVAERLDRGSAATAVQRVSDSDAADGLSAAIDRIAAVARAAKSSDPETADALAERVRALRSAAGTADENAKAELLAVLQEEVGGEIEPVGDSARAGGETVQRVKGSTVAIGLGVAAFAFGIGVLVKKALDARRMRQEDEVVESYFGGRLDPATIAIPPELSAGLAGLAPAAAAARLFQNVNHFPFRYTGQFLTPRVAFLAHQGDCQTLVGLYQEVAHANGIPFAVGSVQGRMLVGPRPIHGRAARGNTYGETDWYFQEHYWAVGNGTPYDVLFMTSPPPAHMLSNGSQAHGGATYYTFPDGRCVIEPEARFGADITGQGRVFANAAAAQLFIANHP